MVHLVSRAIVLWFDSAATVSLHFRKTHTHRK